MDIQAAHRILSPSQCWMFAPAENLPAVCRLEECNLPWIGPEAVPLEGSYVSFLGLKVMEPKWDAPTRELITGTFRDPNATNQHYSPVCRLSREYPPKVGQTTVAQPCQECMDLCPGFQRFIASWNTGVDEHEQSWLRTLRTQLSGHLKGDVPAQRCAEEKIRAVGTKSSKLLYVDGRQFFKGDLVNLP